MNNASLWYSKNEIAAMYRKKLMSADEAVKLVKSGDRIHMGLFAGVVVDLDRALAKRTEELFDVNVTATMWSYPDAPEILKADPEAKHFHYSSTHFTATERRMNKEGCCWPIPVQFRENSKFWAEDLGDSDVAMLQVAPMDQWGNFNLGPQVAEYDGILKRAKRIIVEVNKNQPVTCGMENSINIADVDAIVEGSNTPIPTLKSKDATDVEKRMAGHIVNLIESGSTLQLGTGAFPNYVGSLIVDSDIKDLSVHTEMFVDAYLHLFNAGKITGNKPSNRGKMVFTFAMGSNELYELIHNNPMMCVGPVGYVNDVAVIAQNDKMISINSCLQVDLYGQVNSESAGLQHIGGTGGQVDYVMGAYKSNGGKSFLCTPSTRTLKDGTKQSLIMPMLPQGSIVSTPRTAVHYIVTENGAVNLKGRNTWERAELLVSIADPEFQDELIRNAEKMGIWTKTSKITY